MQLRRITTHGNWIPEIDGLRFVAIAATILSHILGESLYRGTLPPHTQADVLAIIDRGGRGVQLFFAISGFILAHDDQNSSSNPRGLDLLRCELHGILLLRVRVALSGNRRGRW